MPWAWSAGQRESSRSPSFTETNRYSTPVKHQNKGRPVNKHALDKFCTERPNNHVVSAGPANKPEV
jgi:hypothetical protein